VRVVALDFDGVIAESAREAYVVAVRAYLGLRPSTPLGPTEAGAAAHSPADHDFASDPLFVSFCALMPLGNRAEDYGVTLAALEAAVDLPNQSAYDAFFASCDEGFRRDFHARFYVERERLKTSDAVLWRSLQPPYPTVIDALRRISALSTLAIVTAKDAASTRALLAAYGVADLFPANAVYDKETGTSKRTHVARLREVVSCPFEAITFVDDKLRHLDDVAPLGVRCALAGWGYNGTRERIAAAGRGFEVLTLEGMVPALLGTSRGVAAGPTSRGGSGD
jgi:phosphoglycolate phosphatase-like HAD superfamily hydrolase